MRTALTLMAGLTLLGTPARSGEPPRYGVEIKIEEGAQLIGAPIIFAPEGTPATVETELYRMTLTVTPYMRGGTQRLAINSQLHLRREGRWKLAVPAVRHRRGRKRDDEDCPARLSRSTADNCGCGAPPHPVGNPRFLSSAFTSGSRPRNLR